MIKPKFWYGWVMVFICWFFYFVNVGFPMQASSIMNSAMVSELNMDVSIYGIGCTIFNLFTGLLGIIVGRVISKKGAKFAAIIGTILIILGTGFIGLFGSTGGIVVWFIGYAIVMGVGCCFGTALPAQTGVLAWHKRKRSLAMGITMTASALGGFIATPIMSAWVVNNGWAAGWMFIAVLAIVNLVIVWVFMINKPEDIGQEVDNGKGDEPTDAKAGAKAASSYVTTEKWTVAAAMKTPATWLILIALIGTMCAYIAFMNVGILLLMAQGFELSTAAVSLQIIAICSLLSRLVCGWLGDRINPRFVLIGCMVLLIVGVLICTITFDVTLMYVFALLVGLGYGGAFTMVPLILGNYYGSEVYSQVYGNLMPINSIVTALAPTIAGFIYTATGAYTIALYVFAAFAVLGAVCAVLARAPKMPASDKAALSN